MPAQPFQFSTEAYPSDSRAGAWREALRNVALTARAINDPLALHGRIRSALAPLGTSFASLACCAQDLEGLSTPDRQGLWMYLHQEGQASLMTEDGLHELAAGDLAYGPAGTYFTLSAATDFHAFFIQMPRPLLEGRALFNLVRRVELIRGESGLGRIFTILLDSIAGSLDGLTPEDLRPVELALLEFLATCLARVRGDNAPRGETGMQTSLLNRICQHIEANLGDIGLNNLTVAHKMGISPRYVQKLFENAGDNFAHYVRQRRLERCRADLVTPQWENLSITEVAYRWGFNDSAHFSRSFREEYGISPREWRKQGGASTQAESLIGRGWPERSAKALRQEATSRSHKWQYAQDNDTCLADALMAPFSVVEPDDASVALASRHHYLPANEKTVHWGFFSKSLPPVLAMRSGELVTIEAVTHHAGDDYDRMVRGDPGLERIFHWTEDGKTIERRGAGPLDASIYGRGAGEGFGVHLCTGPIEIEGAEPGDVVELRILRVQPRASANPEYAGRTFGSNAAAWWGFHYKDLLTEPKPREVITLYEVECERGAHGLAHACARAAYNFRWTPQRDPSGVVHPTWDYPGVPVDHSTVEKNFDVLKGVRIPIRPHFGVIGLAPREAELVDSIPPAYFGGNLDNWRMGEGAAVYLPVTVPGALLSVGDPHASQGDSELCGTAIECSMTGTFQVILHKRGTPTGKPIADLDYPLLETDTEWVIHGFSHANYLAEFGEAAQSEIYKNASLDPAMRDAFWKVRRFLMSHKGLSEDEAISLISVAVDFGITQVVDGNLCVHAILRKALFEECDG